jgi:topoisomerase IA-like protein
VKHGRLNATIPDSASLDSVTLEEAVALLAAKPERKRKSPSRKRAR